MSMKSIQNKPSRNGFDLSCKKNFTAKAGELLPVICKEVIPGDKFTIDLKAFTRSQPVNTAAFARIREYYDFFYVPYSLLWNRANSVLTQMNYNQMHANNLTDTDSVYNGELPYITSSQIVQYFDALFGMRVGDTEEQKQVKNYFGYSRAHLTAKLLEYLGYGNYYDNTESESVRRNYNPDLNIMGLLAYQKIYADHFRDEQWEKPAPSTFNVDYMSGTTSMNVNIPTYSKDNPFYANYNFFDMRYCNWQKDLYHGLLPHAQYGDTTVVPLADINISKTFGGAVSENATRGELKYLHYDNAGGFSNEELSGGKYVPAGGPYFQLRSANVISGISAVGTFLKDVNVDSSSSGLSILALRQYEFLQKWKEIAQSTGQNYKDQMKAMWNVDVSKHLSHKCTYLGGISSSLDINEVVNTNITESFGAEIAGKGVGISNGKINFESDGQFGILMCIYHALPLVDYTVDYIDPAFTRVNAEDFANPIFDRVGMQGVTSLHIMDTKSGMNSDSPFIMGYAPRYIDYKTSIDLSVGDFKRSLKNWVVAYDYASFRDALIAAGGVDSTLPSPDNQVRLSYPFFKINPAILNPIFSKEVDDSLDSDQFLCSTFFDVKVVRNLDVDGLPY